MSYAANAKNVDKIEVMLDSRSFDPMSFAVELSNRDNEFRRVFFEVALSYIQEVAALETYQVNGDSMMIVYRDIAKKIAEAL